MVSEIGNSGEEGVGMKKLVIDARLTGLKNAGIGRYIENLIGALMKLKEWRTTLNVVEIRPPIRHYTFAEQALMPSALSKEHPDLVHFPHFNVPLLYNKPFVVTIHDLLWHERVGLSVTTLPWWKYAVKYGAYRLVLRHAINQSRAIIVPSEWVKKQLVLRFPYAEGKTKVIYEGVVQSFKSLDSLNTKSNKLLKKLHIEQGEYLVYVGSLYPHKNVNIVLDILPQLPELKFVVVCARSVFWEKFKEEITKRELEHQVILAGFVPDDELKELYEHALAFVFPSLSEGFGLPGLEAMASGCPVISSSAGSLPEIYGDAAVYFDPKLKESLTEKVKNVIDNREHRKMLIALGEKRATLFSWKTCAKETLKVYEAAIKQR